MSNPRYIKAVNLPSELNRQFDTLIVSASYEARCFTLSRSLSANGFKQALVAGNVNHLDYIEPNWGKLCSILGPRVSRVLLNSDKPIVSADNFIKALLPLASDHPASVLIDISTFTREALFMLMGILREVFGAGTEVTFAYNAATSYGWLSRGIREMRSVLGFSGNIFPARRNHLIVLSGYEVERAANLIASYEPNLLSIGYNKKEDSINPDLYDKQMWFVEQLCNLYSLAKVKRFEVSAKDPFRTKEAILSHVGQYKGFNTILAPLNTKVSSVGACLACCEDESIQLCYAQPQIYNTVGYSEPSDDIIVFSAIL